MFSALAASLEELTTDVLLLCLFGLSYTLIGLNKHSSDSTQQDAEHNMKTDVFFQDFLLLLSMMAVGLSLRVLTEDR
jgi:hypothetical protein